MQVANALNNVIRILFNPKIEAFKLFDFLVVKSLDNRYLAQIVEIYDDKFDASQNVAKLKLFYKIAPNNEVIPYDNFTPNKECEIIKIKQEEIENFLNSDKKTFIFGTNIKSSSSFELQYDFFDGNAIVLADKIENSFVITNNLAKNLSQEKHVIVIDSTGVMDLEGTKVIKASDNFKIPLNYSTIDFVFDKCLGDSTLEFQTIVGDIINEIKKFAKKQDDGFISFSAFLKVLLEQYKVTPYQELKLLMTRLKKYQMDEIFARSKKDAELLEKTVSKNQITVVDLSGIDIYWQKAFVEYIVDTIQDEVYLLARFNDENCDVNLINKIYNKKRNIKLVPSVSYSYKKLPTIIQYCKNYILLPSLYQRMDFLDANFALSNLISDGCIVFGEATDNFLYYIKDYSIKAQEKRKNYRKIMLSMVQKDESDFFEEDEDTQKQSADSKKLMDELNKFEQERDYSSKKENFEEIENPKIDHDDFEEVNAQEAQEDIKKIEPEEEYVLEASRENSFEKALEENEIKESADVPASSIEYIEEAAQETIEEPIDETINEPVEETMEESVAADAIETQEPIVSDDSLEIEEVDLEINFENETDSNTTPETVSEEALVEQPVEQNTEPETSVTEETVEAQEAKEAKGAVDFSDEELDFFQQDDDVDSNETIEKKDDVDLSAIADNSINTSFEQIINSKSDNIEEAVNKQDNLEQVATQNEDKDLPIFKEELQKDSQSYSIGDTVYHKNYGKGTIIKLVQYEERQLLQIEFEEAGKKLLDPKVADIKTAQ